MKKIIVVSLVILLVMPSCKFIKTKFLSKKVDTLSAFVDTVSHAEYVDSSIYYQDMMSEIQQEQQQEASPVDIQPQSLPATNAQFYMIVGCFMVPENASRYAEKIRGMGYEGEIIFGTSGLQMVSARSYNNFRTSVAEIDQFRADITPNAWVYVRK
ncbi:MAG: hypothetical protein JXK95_15890 [Bacteroidales bacterium]|nr:hypothetical protein [Bacteroidales bacterium]